MADIENKEPQVQEEDKLKNIKEEMNRKISNLESKITQSYDIVAEQLSTLLKTQSTPEKPSSEYDFSSFDTPSVDPKKLKDDVMKDLHKEIQQKEAIKAQQQQVLMSLYEDYPELADINSELTKKSLENYKKLSPKEQELPSSYKAVVFDASRELGILPARARKTDTEMVGSSKSVRASKGRHQEMEDDKLDELTLEFAKILDKGMVKNPDRLKRLKGYQKKMREAERRGRPFSIDMEEDND